jgi:hypothetical protein
MKWFAMLFAALLLAGCTKASMPDLEDLPSAIRGSSKPAAEGPGGATESVGQGPLAEVKAVAVARAVEITPEQQSDIKRGVKRGLPISMPLNFGPMAATHSKFTTKSYIVCGWVRPGQSSAYRPFLAIYVPHMKIALLLGVGGRQNETTIRQRCAAERIQLESAARYSGR